MLIIFNFHHRVTLMRLEPSHQRHTFGANFLLLLLDQSVCYRYIMNKFFKYNIHVRKNNPQTQNPVFFLSFYLTKYFR